jgi:hypothetical protein
LAIWGSCLSGWDIHPEFIQAARHRILLAAIARCSRISAGELPPNGGQLSRVETADAIGRLEAGIPDGTIVLLNPPFGSAVTSKRRMWADGLISNAAVYVESVLDALGKACFVVAILPDVLRTGSRYERWRDMVDRRCDIFTVKALGLFDRYADVDVFLLGLKLKKDIGEGADFRQGALGGHSWYDVPNRDGKKVGDYFAVNVGPVVDNRDPLEGEERSYLKARDIPLSGIFAGATRLRKFEGRLFEPPFVLIRRTSRPSVNGQARSPGVLVAQGSGLAIDNHLFVAKPRDGQIETCISLLRVLDRSDTSEFLDQRIRCRHLTVDAVCEIPWRC